MYVWFDALTNYISALGWPEDTKNFEDFWGTNDKPNAIQVAGKDNLRQQSAMWLAMLMAADLPPTKQIFIHGFITSGGQKMSKTLGNIIDPFEYVEKYRTDALRYYLLAKISPTEDSDFTKEKFEQVYQSDLANGLGNLVARVAKLAENFDFPPRNIELVTEVVINSKKIATSYKKLLDNFQFDEALNLLWLDIKIVDQYLNEEQPWTLDKEKQESVISIAVDAIRYLSNKLKPFLPETAEKIEKQFLGPKIKSAEPLFPRLQTPGA
jgi:methionyl-tRNA synthetase